MNDFLETETHTGFFRIASLFRFDNTSMSRVYQGRSTIFVKNGFLPSCRKKPIDGSTIMLPSSSSSLTPAFFAKAMLSLNALTVPGILPVVAGERLLGPTMTG